MSFVPAGQRAYGPREVVIRDGEYACWLHFPISGQLDIFRKGEPITPCSAAAS